MDGLMELEELYDNSRVEVDRSRSILDRVVRFDCELERSTPFAGCGFICHKLVSLVVLNTIYDCCLLREESASSSLPLEDGHCPSHQCYLSFLVAQWCDIFTHIIKQTIRPRFVVVMRISSFSLQKMSVAVNVRWKFGSHISNVTSIQGHVKMFGLCGHSSPKKSSSPSVQQTFEILGSSVGTCCCLKKAT